MMQSTKRDHLEKIEAIQQLLEDYDIMIATQVAIADLLQAKRARARVMNPKKYQPDQAAGAYSVMRYLTDRIHESDSQRLALEHNRAGLQERMREVLKQNS